MVTALPRAYVSYTIAYNLMIITLRKYLLHYHCFQFSSDLKGLRLREHSLIKEVSKASIDKISCS